MMKCWVYVYDVSIVDGWNQPNKYKGQHLVRVNLGHAQTMFYYTMVPLLCVATSLLIVRTWATRSFSQMYIHYSSETAICSTYHPDYSPLRAPSLWAYGHSMSRLGRSRVVWFAEAADANHPGVTDLELSLWSSPPGWLHCGCTNRSSQYMSGRVEIYIQIY